MDNHVARYICVITGAIGAGKTTVFKKINEILKERYKNDVLSIPEYIDSPDNSELYRRNLDAYLHGGLNDQTFQNMIQFYYEQALNPVAFTDKIVIMERSMSDSISIFCNLAFHRGRLDITNFSLLHGVCLIKDRAVNCPNFFIGNFEFSKIDSTLSESLVADQILKIIESDLENGVNNRVFGLDCHFSVCKDRIDKRSRIDEASIYDHTYTALNTSMYSNLYNFLEESPHSIQFTQLSELFDKNLLKNYLLNQGLLFINSKNYSSSISPLMDIVKIIRPNSEDSFRFHYSKFAKSFNYSNFQSTLISFTSKDERNAFIRSSLLKMLIILSSI